MPATEASLGLSFVTDCERSVRPVREAFLREVTFSRQILLYFEVLGTPHSYLGQVCKVFTI